MTTPISIRIANLLRATPAGLRVLAQVCHTPGAVPQPQPSRSRPYVRRDGKRFDKRTGTWR
jgi:hypothetical protein